MPAYNLEFAKMLLSLGDYRISGIGDDDLDEMGLSEINVVGFLSDMGEGDFQKTIEIVEGGIRSADVYGFAAGDCDWLALLFISNDGIVHAKVKNLSWW